jgi:hypothetical protein
LLTCFDAPDVPLVGQKLTANLISAIALGQGASADQLGDLCTTSFAILLRELDLRPEAEHPSQLDLIVASFISLNNELGQNRQSSAP